MPAATREGTALVAPWTAYQAYTGLEVPDPITFVMGPQWLDSPSIYPRQGTFLKIIFLRDDLFTQYDHDVIAEWIELYKETGNEGCSPDVYERIRILKEEGWPWFHEVLAVIGRRGSKGHIGGLAGSYVLWNYMAKGDPQGYYGIDRSKRLTALVFAGKKGQARDNQWRDLTEYIRRGPCFAQYISQEANERLSIYAPYDAVKRRKALDRGSKSDIDYASFEILPKEATPMAGRGPASFMQHYDEMAHVVASGANRSAGEVYQAAKPSLDQFGKDGFIYEPSSPWQMIGQFYENYLHALEVDPENQTPTYPEMFFLQLPSWGLYEDWERAHLIPTGTGVTYQAQHRAPQVFDKQMEREERANPEKFAVERRSRFAAAQGAYLSKKKIDQMFAPWQERPEVYGPPELQFQDRGILIRTYKAHGDPSKCLTGDSLVFSDQGLLRLTQVEAGDRLVNSVGTDHVAEWMESGEKDILRLRLKYGYEVRGSAEHPVLTQRGWVRLADLVSSKERAASSARMHDSAADQVVMSCGAELWATQYVQVPRSRVPRRSNGSMCYPVSEVDERMGRLMGYLVSEGSYEHHALSVTAHVDEPTCDESIDLVRHLFGVEPAFDTCKGKARTVGWQNTHLMLTLSELGIFPLVRAANKIIPWSILQSPKSVVQEFLRAYFQGDGTVSKADARDRAVSVSTASSELARQVQTLLLNMGIVAQRESFMQKYNAEGDRRRYWRVNVRGEYLKRFAVQVGFLCEVKKARLHALQGFPTNPVSDVLALPVWSVTSDGREQTYDLTMMSGEHNFVADGVVCHNSQANFGFAIAHPEVDEQGTIHCVFDVIHHWDPADYEDHQVNYLEIEEELFDYIRRFTPDEMTFDQFNSGSTIQKLAKKVRDHGFPKNVQIYEKTATAGYNWKRNETFKTALGMGWIHAPLLEDTGIPSEHADLAKNELTFLVEKNGKVDKQDVGPVQTKDIADCLMECVMTIIGDQVNAFHAQSLGGALMGGSSMVDLTTKIGRGEPMSPVQPRQSGASPNDELSGFGRATRAAGKRSVGQTPSRGRRFR